MAVTWLAMAAVVACPLVENPEPLGLLDDQVGDGVRLARLHLLVALPIFQQPVEGVQIAVQLPGHHHRLQVVDQRGGDAPLGRRPLGGVVGVVDIQMGHPVDPDVREATGGQPRGLPGQEFQVAVGPHVDHQVRSELARQPFVGRHILVRRGHVGVVEDLADLTVAAGAGAAPLGLDADHRVAVADPGDHELPVVKHGGGDPVPGLPRRIPPRLAHPLPCGGGQLVKPAAIAVGRHEVQRPTVRDDLLRRRPSELGDRLAPHDRVNERLAALRRRHDCIRPPASAEGSGRRSPACPGAPRRPRWPPPRRRDCYAG